MSDDKIAKEHTDRGVSLSENSSEKTDSSDSLSRKGKRCLKIFAGMVVVIFVVVVCGVFVFNILRARGKDNLKAEEHYTVYNGKEYKYRENVINILCLGIDKTAPLSENEEGRNNIGMADTVVVASIDVEKNEISLIAIPRDTMAEVQTTINGELDAIRRLQICYQYAYGATMEQGNELTVEAVSKLLYNTPIQRCCTINIEAIIELNDAIGGVDVNVLEDLTEWDSNLPYGARVHLEDRTALNFIQVRNTHSIDGATLRTERQKQYALAFFEKAKNVMAEDPTLPIKMFKELQSEGNMCTDLTLEDISYLVPEILEMSFTEDVIQVIPGESVLGENGLAEYHKDVDALKEIVISTFYDEV